MIPIYDICVPFVGPKNFIEPCIESIKRFSSNYRILLFANGPNQTLRDAALRVAAGANHAMFESRDLLPIIKPHNVMLAYSNAPFTVILNDDTEVSEGWLQNMSRCFDNPKVRIAAPLLDCAEGHNDYRVKGPCRDEILYDAPFVDTQCVMLSRQTIRDLGYYSEEMNYRWDTEYALRCKASGYEIAIDCRTVIVHKNGGTAGIADSNISEKCKVDLAVLEHRYPYYVPIWRP